MFPLLSPLLSIFVTYPKEKIKENDFFFLENLGTHAEVPEDYKYPKNIQYRYSCIFGVPVLHSRAPIAVKIQTKILQLIQTFFVWIEWNI